MALKTLVFAAVRKSSTMGDEWVDIQTCRPLRDMAKSAAAEQDARIPEWSKANPVIRIVPFDLTERPC